MVADTAHALGDIMGCAEVNKFFQSKLRALVTEDLQKFYVQVNKILSLKQELR